MTLQDSESVGQSQLRAVGPLGYSRPRGKASHWFPRSGPCCSLIGRELPSLLENVAGSQTSDVLCVRRKSHGGVRRSWNTCIFSQDRNTTGAAAFIYHTYPFKY